ncbi:MAG: S8 family serine peptidase [Bdellovibrionaceae bacterium]|nr:S8 family serine peptidase [Bdellovibrionales bacterium]MCB9085112.1 S8 family serine peptidase [Pseudobdellovibrionaceae bacterium]
MKREQARRVYTLALLTGILLKGQIAGATLSPAGLNGESQTTNIEWRKDNWVTRYIPQNDFLYSDIHPSRYLERFSSFVRLPQQSCSAKSKHAPILVAVIDTGIDTEHPALQNQLWTNPGETGIDLDGNDRSRNGIDDDNNGYVDDVHGWNFVGNNAELKDRHGHGTHISGIIVANPQNGRPSPSPCPQPIRLMVLKYFDPSDSMEFNLRNTVLAIRYATRMGAQIINYSAGGPMRNYLEEKSIRDAERRGILFVAAAGNDNNDVDQKGFFPASYGLSNILSVTATGANDLLLAGSNFGRLRVDLAAPGQDIYSSLPENRYGPMSGTSQATAFVTRMAAHAYLISKEKPKPERLRQMLLRRGIRDRRLAGKTRYQVRLRETRIAAGTKAKVEPLAFSFSEPTGGTPTSNKPSL